MTFDDLAPYVEPGRVGLFIGGSTAWKEQSIIPWGTWAAARGVYCHVGRVNTVRRIALCRAGHVSSFDGSSPSRYSKNVRKLTQARDQLALGLE